MAKLGEGDRRWIVQDLGEQGRNVSSWHWEEKNLTPWTHDQLKQLLKDLTLVDSPSIIATQVSKIDGETTYCQRKGKNMFFFDLNLTVEWKGQVNDSDVSGELQFPEISQDLKVEDIEINVSAKSDDDNHDTAKKAIRERGIPVIREKLREFLAILASQFSELRTGSSPSIASPNASPNTSTPSLSSSAGSSSSASTSVTTVSTQNGISTQSFKIVVDFSAPPSEIFQCLTDRGRMSVFTQSNAVIAPEEGSSFSLFHDSINGTVVKINPNEKIVQKWRFQSWPANHYSNLTITLTDKSGSTRLSLEQTGVPSDDFDRTRLGWRSHFWERIRMVFGFNFKEIK